MSIDWRWAKKMHVFTTHHVLLASLFLTGCQIFLREEMYGCVWGVCALIISLWEKLLCQGKDCNSGVYY